MKKKTTSKLLLRKLTVAHLNESVQNKLKGGGPLSIMSACILCITKGDCDMPTIGHDDGPYCISKNPDAWCGGIG
jgi:hypothetical protein